MTGRGRLIATGVAVSDIINVLTGVTGRLVVDKTGLSGPFDVNLAWTPDPALQAVIRQNDPLSVPDAPTISPPSKSNWDCASSRPRAR